MMGARTNYCFGQRAEARTGLRMKFSFGRCQMTVAKRRPGGAPHRVPKCQSMAPESESGEASSVMNTSSASSTSRGKASQLRNARLRGRRGKKTVEEMSEIKSEMIRFQCAYDDAEKTGEREKRWHVISIQGARREKSYSEKLLQAFERDMELGRWDEGQSLEVMTPVVQFEYEEVETGKMKRKTGRWPTTDVLWIRCVLDNQMKKFLRKQTFVRNIFSGEPVVHLKDFAFQQEYDEVRSDDESTLLTCTEMLRRAHRVECHTILDPEIAGFDVHTQLTELFYQKYAHLTPEDKADVEEEIHVTRLATQDEHKEETSHENEDNEDNADRGGDNKYAANTVLETSNDGEDGLGLGLWGDG